MSTETFNTLMQAIYSEKTLSEGQVLEVKGIENSLIGEGKSITLTESEAEKFVSIREKMEIFEDSLCEDTKERIINEDFLRLLGGGFADSITLKNMRSYYKINSPDKVLENLSKLEKDAIEMIKELWPADKKEPTKVYLASQPIGYFILDKEFVRQVTDEVTGKRDLVVTEFKRTFDFSKAKQINTAISKDRDSLIRAVKEASAVVRKIAELQRKKTGSGDSESLGAVNKIFSVYVTFLEIVRQQSRMAA